MQEMISKFQSLPVDKRKDATGNLLLFSMFALEVAFLYSASSIVLIPCGILGAVAYVRALKDDALSLRLIACVAVAVVVLVSINRVLTLNCSWTGCLRIVFISLPIAYLLCNVRINRRAAIAFFYAVLIYTVIMIAIADPAELYRIFAASSRSYISVLLIACLFPYYLACKSDRSEASIFPALLSLLVSVYVQSRGGITALGILFALTAIRRIYVRTRTSSIEKRRFLIICLIISVFLLGIGLFVFVSHTNYFSRFFEAEGYPVKRLDMWKEYIDATGLSILNTLIGPPLTTCPLILQEGYNIHNSYFMVHAYTGIIGFVAVVAGGIGYLALCAKRKEYNLLFLAIAFLFRATTDYLFPMQFCDCIILFMIIQSGTWIMGLAHEYKERKILNDSNTSV